MDNGERVKVAIIDSGIDECEGIEVKERYNLVPGEEGILPIYDDFTGHGTAIAGIIAGAKTKDRNVEGINDNVELYSIKIMNGDNTAPLSRVVEAMYKAIEYDVDIINLSLGTTINSEILHQAVKDAYNAGILIVAAAGNRGKIDGVVEYPAAYDEVLGVGSVDSNADISYTSSYGEQVDIMAPGELVKTVANFGLETVSSGTSMAVPHVVGIASVLWQKDKSKSVDFIRGLIEATGNEVLRKGKKYKVIDLEYALNKYSEYEGSYKKISYKVKSNPNVINTCEAMGQVTARWSKDNHEALVSKANSGTLTTKQLNIIKVGIRYNDVKLLFDKNNYPNRDIWHSLNSDTNYMSAVFFVGKVIQDSNVDPYNVTRTPGLVPQQYEQMKKDIKDIDWKAAMNIKGLDYADTKDNRRLLLFGMSLHIITDAFAHRAWMKTTGGDRWSGWFHIGDPNTDNITVVPSRYSAAGQVVKNAINLALNTSNIKKSYTIRSKQIMYNNTYFDGTYALKQLMHMAKVNQANDNTYNNWYKQMALYTYTDIESERQELDAIVY